MVYADQLGEGPFAEVAMSGLTTCELDCGGTRKRSPMATIQFHTALLGAAGIAVMHPDPLLRDLMV